MTASTITSFRALLRIISGNLWFASMTHGVSQYDEIVPAELCLINGISDDMVGLFYGIKRKYLVWI